MNQKLVRSWIHRFTYTFQVSSHENLTQTHFLLDCRGITVKKIKKVNPSRWGFAHINPLPCSLYFLS